MNSLLICLMLSLKVFLLSKQTRSNGCLQDAKYHIELTDATPVKQRYRPIHPKIRDQVQQQLKVMLDSGVIQESTSPWSSPLTVAKKIDGSLRDPFFVKWKQVFL